MATKSGQIQTKNAVDEKYKQKTNLEINGVNYGKLSYKGIAALQNGTINSYTPADEEEKKTLESFKNNYKVDIIDSKGVNHGQMSYGDVQKVTGFYDSDFSKAPALSAVMPIAQEYIVSTLPDVSGDVWNNYTAAENKYQRDEYREQYIKDNNLGDLVKRYGIDPLDFGEAEFEKWRKQHHIEYEGTVNEGTESSDVYLVSEKDGNFFELLFGTADNLASEQELKDAERLWALSKNNERIKSSQKDLGGVYSFVGGLTNGVSFGLWDAGNAAREKLEHKQAGLTEDGFVSTPQSLARTYNEHKFAYGGGQLAGAVVASMGVGGLVSGGLTAAGWAAGTATIARGAVVQGLTGVLRGGITTAAAGGDWGDIGINALREGLTGAAGGAIGGIAEKGLTKLLTNSKYATSTLGKLKNLKLTAYGVNAVGGITDALADYGTDQLFVGIANNVFDANLQERTGQDLLTDFAVSLALGTAMNMRSYTKAGVEARVEDIVNRYGAEYTKYSNAIKDADVETKIKAGEEFIEATNKFKKELNEQLFPGKAKEVETLHEMLDVAIDSTKMDIERAKNGDNATVEKSKVKAPVSTEMKAPIAPKAITEVKAPVSTEGGTVRQDVSGAIERVKNGTATNKDLDMFKASKTANRKMLEDALGIKLPETNNATRKVLKELPARLNPTADNITKLVGEGQKASVEASVEKIKTNLEGTGKDVNEVVSGVSNLTNRTVEGINKVFGIEADYGKILDTNLKALADNPDNIISDDFTDTSFVKGYAEAIGEKLKNASKYSEALGAKIEGISPSALQSSYFSNAPINPKVSQMFRRVVDGSAQNLKAVYDSVPSKVKAETPSVRAEETAPIPKVEEPTTPTVKAEEVIPVSEDIPNVETTQSGAEAANSFVNEDGLEFTRVDDIDDFAGVRVYEGLDDRGNTVRQIQIDTPNPDDVIKSYDYRDLIEDAAEIKDVRGTTLTPDRAFEKAFGKNYAKFNKVIYDNLDMTKLQYMELLDYLTRDLEKNVISRGITKGSDDSALLQLYGEGKINLNELKAQTDNWQNIVEADKYMRQMYDSLIDSLNAQKKKIYPYIEEQEAKLKSDLEEVNKALDLIELGNLDRLPLTRTEPIRRAKQLEQVLKDMDINSKAEIKRIDAKIENVKAEMEGKKNKETKVYAQLSNKLANLEAQKTRISEYYDLSKSQKEARLKKLLDEYESTDALELGVAKKGKADLEDKRKRIEEELNDELRWRGKRIPKRKDYYHHFQELSKSILGELLDRGNSNISAELVLVSGKTKPKSKWEGFAQRRKGDETVIDAVGGYLDYIKGASYGMTVDTTIPIIRQLSTDLQRQTSSSNPAVYGTNNANNVILRLNDLANELAGKTVVNIDRDIQEMIGRKNFRLAKKITNKLKAASIVGNIGSAVVQISNVPNAIAMLDNKATFISAISDSYKELGKGNNLYDAIMGRTEAQKQSSFLRERYFDDVASRFDKGVGASAQKFTNWLLTVGDEISTRMSWNAFYREALKKGVENPIKYADQKTRRAVGGRGIGEKSVAQQSTVVGAAFPFTLEVSNTMQVQADLFKNLWNGIKKADLKGVSKAVGNILSLYIANFIVASALESIRGNDGGIFNPIGRILEVVDDDEKENKVLESAKAIGGNLLSSHPLGQTAAGYMPEDMRKTVFGDEDPLRYGESSLYYDAGERIWKFASNPNIHTGLTAVSSFVPFGAQARKTSAAMKILQDGGVYDNEGKLRYPIEKTPANVAKGLAFGKSAFKETNEYYDNGGKPLTAEQTEFWKYRVGQGENPIEVYNEYQAENNADAVERGATKQYNDTVDDLVKPTSTEFNYKLDKYSDFGTGTSVPQAQKTFSYNGKKYELTAEQCAELQNMYNTEYEKEITKVFNMPATDEVKYKKIASKKEKVVEKVKKQFYKKFHSNIKKVKE